MAIEKEIVQDNGERKKYFRITKVVLDYENKKYDVECASYVDESYRNQEKEREANYEKDKKEYYELEKIEEKTEEEIARLSELNISEIENKKMTWKPLYLKLDNFEIELTDELRDTFYTLLKNSKIFKNAKDIFEPENFEKEEKENV